MRITVYGATGAFGARLVDLLRSRDHEVIPAHRGNGVDTYTGEGVAEAADGSDALVDCVNRLTTKPRKAIDFFSRSTQSIARAAAEYPELRSRACRSPSAPKPPSPVCWATTRARRCRSASTADSSRKNGC